MSLEHFSVVTHTKPTPEVAEIILACYKDRSAYRAVVTTVEEHSVNVRFVDFGDEATVTAADIWELNEEINQVRLHNLLASTFNQITNSDHDRPIKCICCSIPCTD